MWQQLCCNSPTSILCWPSCAPDSCTSGGPGVIHRLAPCTHSGRDVNSSSCGSHRHLIHRVNGVIICRRLVSIAVTEWQRLCLNRVAAPGDVGFLIIYRTTDADQCLLWLDWHPHLSCSQYCNNIKAFISLCLLVLCGYNIITTQWHLLTCWSWVRSLPPTQYDISASLHIGNIKSMIFPPSFCIL